MTVSHGVEGQLISEARICIYSEIKALRYVANYATKIIVRSLKRYFN